MWLKPGVGPIRYSCAWLAWFFSPINGISRPGGHNSTICMVFYALSRWLCGCDWMPVCCVPCVWLVFRCHRQCSCVSSVSLHNAFFCFCPCAMMVMLGRFSGFCHEPLPRSAPLCLCPTALPLSHCLTFVMLPVGPGSALGPSAISLIWAFSIGRALPKLLCPGCALGAVDPMVYYCVWCYSILKLGALGPSLVHVAYSTVWWCLLMY